jgi:hypothetical protein
LNSTDENFCQLKESVNKICHLYKKLKPGLIPIVIINPRYWIALGLFLLGEIDEASGFIEQNLNVIDRVSESISEEEMEQFIKSEIYIKNNELMKKIEYIKGESDDWK